MGWSWDGGFPVFDSDPSFDLPPIDGPTAGELFDYLGWPAPDEGQEAQGLQAIAVSILMAYSHTRGKGFQTPNMAPELRAVILAQAARTLANPTAAKRIEAGTYSETPANPGWLLHERLVLDSYRRQAA